jgi:hypothetical protein
VSFAIYAGLRDYIGPAWASAAVAGIVALIALILALIATRKAKPRLAKEEPPSPIGKLLDLARERPAIAAAAAIAAGVAASFVAIKNPRILTAIIAGLTAPRQPPPRR